MIAFFFSLSLSLSSLRSLSGELHKLHSKRTLAMRFVCILSCFVRTLFSPSRPDGWMQWFFLRLRILRSSPPPPSTLYHPIISMPFMALRVCILECYHSSFCMHLHPACFSSLIRALAIFLSLSLFSPCREQTQTAFIRPTFVDIRKYRCSLALCGFEICQDIVWYFSYSFSFFYFYEIRTHITNIHYIHRSLACASCEMPCLIALRFALAFGMLQPHCSNKTVEQYNSFSFATRWPTYHLQGENCVENWRIWLDKKYRVELNAQL